MKIKVYFILYLLTVTGMSAQSMPVGTVSFRKIVEDKFQKINVTDFARICPIDTDLSARTIFAEYGAIFIADGVTLPPKCIFDNESDVANFHTQVESRTELIGGVRITLQESAMRSLLNARKAALKLGLNISPRGGSLAGTRSYNDTVRLWNSRFYPALDYWVTRGKIKRAEAASARLATIRDQITKVLEWEQDGIFFSKDLSKSILYSVAAPGASQHIFQIAVDIQQFGNGGVRKILAENGWFQTVRSDLPHFTYLGHSEDKLSSLGLTEVSAGGQKFWIPNLK